MLHYHSFSDQGHVFGQYTLIPAPSLSNKHVSNMYYYYFEGAPSILE